MVTCKTRTLSDWRHCQFVYKAIITNDLLCDLDLFKKYNQLFGLLLKSKNLLVQKKQARIIL